MNDNGKKQKRSLFASLQLWSIGYLLMLAAVTYGMFQVRNWSATTFDNETAVRRWQEWRQDVIDQPDDAPVTRRVPKSEQPPAFVLLHDYFAVCLALAVVLCTALYFTLMVTVRGALTSPGKIHFE